MKGIKFIFASIIAMALVLVSCGGGSTGEQLLQGLVTTALNGGQPTAVTTTPTTTGSQAGADILGGLLGAVTGTQTTSGTQGLLTGVIGALLNGGKSASIVGTWVYNGPSVEFESENLLAQAGGAVAANQLINKMSPYYEKLGIKPGAVVMKFNQDNTCVIQVSGKTQTAQYAYDPNAHTLKITGQNLGLSFGTAYATVSATQMSLTFDSTKILGIAQGLATASGNTTLSTISSLSQSFKGMKTGFKFVKQ